MTGARGRFAFQMARLATTHRPPVLTALCLFGAVALAPTSHRVGELEAVPTARSAAVIEFSGDRRIVIPMPPIDQAMVIKPPAIDPLIFIRDVGFDDLLSGFLGLLTTPDPPHC